MFLALLACTPIDSGDDSAATSQEVDDRLPPAELTEPTGSCPELDDGKKVAFESSGVEREVKILLPDELDPGLPVIFAWHPLGVSTRSLISYLDLDSWAEQNDVIVVVPESDPDNLFDWDFWNGEEDDLVMFDDLRSCLSEELEIDLRRVYSSGMSAGGLMTSHLSIHRGDTLAAILPMSGGTDPVVQYETPDYLFPAMLTYGGESDTWGGGGVELDFQEATLAFADQLAGDGHVTVVCNHDGGHDFPPYPMEYVEDWLLPHVFGEPSPYTDDISELADICERWTVD